MHADPTTHRADQAPAPHPSRSAERRRLLLRAYDAIGELLEHMGPDDRSAYATSSRPKLQAAERNLGDYYRIGWPDRCLDDDAGQRSSDGLEVWKLAITLAHDAAELSACDSLCHAGRDERAAEALSNDADELADRVAALAKR